LVLQAQSQTEKWDLKRCVEYATSHNISVKQADIQARIAALQA
jgi:outer membrane protein